MPWTICRIVAGILLVAGGLLVAASDHLPAGLVLAAGGAVLLSPLHSRLRRRATGPVLGAAAVAGTLVGLVVHTSAVAGAYVYTAHRGWPFRWLTHSGVGDDPDAARRIAVNADWSPDPARLAGNLLFWACAAMLLIAAATLIPRRDPGR